MPRIRPYLPLPKDLTCILPRHNSFNLSLAARPNFFSAKSLVLLSGVSMPANLTRCLCNFTSKPKSNVQSNVSPSTIRSNVAL